MNEKTWEFITPGIPDERFIRGDIPMTKEEIRCLTLSRLRLKPDSHVVDVGAGTGTIAIESALLLKRGRVTAVEKEAEGARLIRENARVFGVENLKVICGRAPEALEGLGPADRIVIGGTGGSMEEILQASRELLQPGGILVLNCILLESLSRCLETLKQLDFSRVAVINVAISRGQALAGQTMLKPLNPVFILSAEKRG